MAGMTQMSAVKKILIEASKRFNLSWSTLNHIIFSCDDTELDLLNEAYLANDREMIKHLINKYQ